MKKDNKTIGLTIRFFTNDLPDKIEDCHVMWETGEVYAEANKTKGIKATGGVFFQDMTGIDKAINKVLGHIGVVTIKKNKQFKKKKKK
jgi:hypothetical protein